jgi:general secretion pathway protein A
VDHPREPRSLADDEQFAARLGDLDRGLVRDADPGPQNRAVEGPGQPSHGGSAPPGRTKRPPLAAPPPHRGGSRRTPLPPSIASPFDAPSATGAATPPPQQAPTRDQPAVLRPFVDLFPPDTPVEKPAVTIGGPAAAASEERTESQPPARANAVTGSADTGYESFYGFHEPPFSLSTDPHVFFHSTPHDAVGQQLLSAVRQRAGLVVLTGETGTGKTTLCRTVIEQMDRRTLTSFVTDPFVSAEDLLKTILVDFGVTSRAQLARGDATRHELGTTLLSFVDSLSQLQATAIVIIDEAQNLPPDVMEQIRMLAEAGDASSLVQVVLVGQPSLTARLRRREYAALRQRAAVRATLTPLPADEIDGYIVHRLTGAGTTPRVHFEQPALDRIYRLSRGVPRLINLICDRALARGFQASANVIGAALIDAAAEDIDLAEPPSPYHALLSNAAAVAALAICMLLGAGLAAWTFHDAFTRALALWRR